MLQSSQTVIIKGVREGLLLILDDEAPFAEVLTELSERFNSNPGFFKGAGVTINAGRRVVDRPEFDVLYRMLTRNGTRVHTLVSQSAQTRMVGESFGVSSRPPSFAAGDTGGTLGFGTRSAGYRPGEAPADAAAEASEGLFLKCNLRTGQSVRVAGDICLVGNIEAGAEIVAGGSIVVWGSIRGTVHAGANGDDKAVICALLLSPAQLGIAGVVSRFPAPEMRQQGSERTPELAKIETGRIVVETWLGDAQPPVSSEQEQ